MDSKVKQNQDLVEIRRRMDNVIRGLSMDAVQRANSGHPGIAIGQRIFNRENNHG